MKLSSVRVLVKGYKKCFKFYTEQLGLEVPLRAPEGDLIELITLLTAQ